MAGMALGRAAGGQVTGVADTGFGRGGSGAVVARGATGAGALRGIGPEGGAVWLFVR